MRGGKWAAALSDEARRRLLAERGRYPIGASADEIAQTFERLCAENPALLLDAARAQPRDLEALFRASGGTRFPGRSEALLKVARALGLRLPDEEYALPEARLEALLARAQAALGKRVPVRGRARHKGRVGDGVERLLTGGKVAGRASDHPEAEIKSVPVRGDQVIERVKLGVISPTSNPLKKCGRILFVFVERRGSDHFVRGHRLEEFSSERFQAMWEGGFLVETAAGSPRHPARGLYLTPKWFLKERLWPGR